MLDAFQKLLFNIKLTSVPNHGDTGYPWTLRLGTLTH